MSIEQEDAKKELKNYNDISVIQNTDGGKILLKELSEDIVSCIEKISEFYAITKEVELRAYCAELDEKLKLYSKMLGSKHRAETTRVYLKDIIETESTKQEDI